MHSLYKVQTRFLFHSHIRIKIPAIYPDDIFDDFYKILEEVNQKYNSYEPNSYIDQINQHAGHFVEVDDETTQLLNKIISLSHFFNGTYDITVMPLIRLWGFYKNNVRRKPTLSEIKEAQTKINYKNIEIDGNRVRIKKGQEIITGSFIKAYAVDKLINFMKKREITSAIVNAGGSTIRAINNEIESPWQVNAVHPENDTLLFTINLNNCAYSTSSQSSSFVDINGKKYGHILNPLTGYPSQNKLLGLITESCLLGDIISTGLFNESPKNFLKKVQQLSGHYHLTGFIMGSDHRITTTPFFKEKLEESKTLKLFQSE